MFYFITYIFLCVEICVDGIFKGKLSEWLMFSRTFQKEPE